MKPEEKTEIIIFNWLIPYIDSLYFNRKNILNYPVFKVSGNNKQIPDLIIKLKSNKYIAIEVKPNKANLVKLGHTQLFERYWKDYCLGKTNYIINNKIIKIDKFVLCSDSSLKGYLFKNEDIKDNLIDSNLYKIDCVNKYKIIPRFEGVRTHDSIRTLWDSLREFRKKNELVKLSDLGILINDIENKKPYIFVISNVNNKWGQHYWSIDK